MISNKRLILKCIFNNEINELTCTRNQPHIMTIADLVFAVTSGQFIITCKLRHTYRDFTIYKIIW
jgi:hypothetical protein